MTVSGYFPILIPYPLLYVSEIFFQVGSGFVFLQPNVATHAHDCIKAYLVSRYLLVSAGMFRPQEQAARESHTRQVAKKIAEENLRCMDNE
jgi:hypothetical protein